MGMIVVIGGRPGGGGRAGVRLCVLCVTRRVALGLPVVRSEVYGRDGVHMPPARDGSARGAGHGEMGASAVRRGNEVVRAICALRKEYKISD
jgi:hypothetical protein